MKNEFKNNTYYKNNLILELYLFFIQLQSIKIRKMKLYSSILIILLWAYINATPLDDYVHAPDPNYGYTLLKTYNQDGYTLYVYNFTSQKWLDGTYYGIL